MREKPRCYGVKELTFECMRGCSLVISLEKWSKIKEIMETEYAMKEVEPDEKPRCYGTLLKCDECESIDTCGEEK